MIKYRLQCAKGHQFEGWFNSSAAYDKQAKRGLVVCPSCGSKKVSKGLMAPSVVTGKRKAARKAAVEAPAPAPDARPAEGSVAVHSGAEEGMRREMLTMMRKIRDEVRAKAEYVGPRFAEEARKIHYEEMPARGIYGEATATEVSELKDEGIEFHPLPILPEDQN